MKIATKKGAKNSELIIGPAMAVDVLIFAIREEKLNVLLIQINNGPYKGKWALPGGIVALEETLDETAERVLEKKAGIKGIYLEQLYTFGKVDRDVRGRIASVAYFALVNSDKFAPKTNEYYADIAWKEVDDLPSMAFDHKEMVRYGVHRLQSKIEYSNIAYGLLPKEFTLTEIQKVYEVILGKELDKRNFRKKMKMLDLIEPTKHVKYGMRNRPAEMYKFKKRSLVFTK